MLKDILRKYPDRYEEVIPALEKCLRDVDEPEVCFNFYLHQAHNVARAVLIDFISRCC